MYTRLGYGYGYTKRFDETVKRNAYTSRLDETLLRRDGAPPCEARVTSLV